jgi:hypothetical protein
MESESCASKEYEFAVLHVKNIQQMKITSRSVMSILPKSLRWLI